MTSKRCEVSEDLLPYRKFFRGINEPKYDFRSGLKIRRKRKAPSQLPDLRKVLLDIFCASAGIMFIFLAMDFI